MKEKIIKKYSNDEITVIWQPDLCTHSTICWNASVGLPGVFNPDARPWINMNGDTTERIAKQVNKCPSGALSYRKNNESGQQAGAACTKNESVVEIVDNGPLLVYGNIILKNKDQEEKKAGRVTAFCRCGASKKKPYCDGAHMKINFED